MIAMIKRPVKKYYLVRYRHIEEGVFVWATNAQEAIRKARADEIFEVSGCKDVEAPLYKYMGVFGSFGEEPPE